MHIFLLIFKIIGILLLSLLGICVLLLLLILFLPVRYRINGEKYEKIKAKLTFHWLFPILYGKMEYAGEQYIYYVRLFGIKIYPKEEKARKPSKNSKTRKEQEKEDKEEVVVAELSKKQESKQEELEKSERSERSEKPERLEKLEKMETPEKPEEKRERKGFCSRIKSTWILLKEKVTGFWKTIKEINRKREIFFAFIRSQENKAGLLQIFTSLKRLLKHLMPGKIRGEVEFGLEDPALTGQVLGVLGMFYGVYKEQLKIFPNFQKSILEGNIFLKGRIRVFTLLRICIKLLLDNDFKQLKDNFNQMKEELE